MTYAEVLKFAPDVPLLDDVLLLIPKEPRTPSRVRKFTLVTLAAITSAGGGACDGNMRVFGRYWS